MIKTFLKHWIFEICIEQIFKTIFNNFKTVDIQKINFRKGQIYSVIEVCKEKELYDTFGINYSCVMVYHNCKIVKVNKCTIKFIASYFDNDFEKYKYGIMNGQKMYNAADTPISARLDDIVRVEI